MVEQLVGSPAQLVAMLDALEVCPSSLTSLRLVKTGGAPLWLSLVEKLKQNFCRQIVDVYSSTEGGPAAIATGQLLNTRGNYLSFLPITQIRSRTDLTSEKSEFSLIEIYSRARAVPFHPDQPFVAPSDDWVRTGDLGKITAEGELQIFGRDKNILNAGGRKFDAELIQAYLKSQQGIQDAGIVISDDESHGSEIWLALCCNEAINIESICLKMQETFHGFSADRILRFEKIPRSSLGKLETATLRKMIRQSLK
jgi:acyl-CoA synthetase (AMP-forming)/AMP-acid ligase II